MSVRSRVASLARFDVLVLASLIWFLGKFLRYLFPPLFGTLQETYGVSNTVLGTAFTGLMLVYAATQFPSGALADRVGPVRVISAGVLLTGLAALSFVVPAPFAVLVGGMLVVGLGTGAHKTVAIDLLSRTYPAHTGRALGVLDTFGSFSGVVAPITLVAFAATVGWRAAFLLAGVVGVALALAFSYRVPRRLPEPSTTQDDTHANARQYVALFTDRQFAIAVALAVLFAFGFNGVVAFLPLYLVEQAGLSQEFAGVIYSGLFVVSLVQPLSGDLSDRIGPLTVMGAAMALASVGLAALVVVSAPLALAAAVLVLGLGSHAFRPVRDAYLVSLLPERSTGGTLGIARTVLMGAAAIAPAIVGVLSDTVDFRFAFGVLVVAQLVSLGLVGVLALGNNEQSVPAGAD
ncbi:MAG: MFS transporter [Halobacteriota archaeon]